MPNDSGTDPGIFSKFYTGKIEQYIGASLAIIGIAALTAEVIISDIKPLAFVRLLAGLLVSVAVLVVSVRSMLKNVEKDKTFESVLQENLASWAYRNSPLIVTDVPTLEYSMVCNHEVIFDTNASAEKYTHEGIAKFALLPEEYYAGCEVKFYLKPDMFAKRAEYLKKPIQNELDQLSTEISNCINAKFDGFVNASTVRGINEITAVLQIDKHDPHEARKIRRLLAYVMTLYLVAE